MANKVITDDILNSYGQEIKDYIDRKEPLISKTYTKWGSNNANIYATSSDNNNTATFYFMYIKPETWYKPWKVKFKVTTTDAAGASYYSISWCEIYGRADSMIYKIWNERYDNSHYYIAGNYATKAGFEGTNHYRHALGVNLIYSNGYTNSAHPRTIKIDYYGCEDCEATIFDTLQQISALEGYSSSNNTNRYNYVNTNMNAIDRGLQETGDNNDTTTIYSYYDRLVAGPNGIMRYALTMRTEDGKFESIVTTDGTGTSKTKNTKGFFLDSLFYNGRSSNTTNGNLLDYGNVRHYQSLIDYRYSINAGNTLTGNNTLYLKGTISNGLFYLDDTWWTETLPNTNDGKVYIRIGVIYPDGAGKTYRCDFSGLNEVLIYNGSKYVPYQSKYLTSHQSLANYYTKTEVDNKGYLTQHQSLTNYATKTYVDSKVAGVYKPMGTISPTSFSNAEWLQSTLVAAALGNVYNSNASFTSNEYFVDGANKLYPKGSNVVVVQTGTNEYKLDVLSGIVDLSDYVTTSSKASTNSFGIMKVGTGLSVNDGVVSVSSVFPGLGSTGTTAAYGNHTHSEYLLNPNSQSSGLLIYQYNNKNNNYAISVDTNTYALSNHTHSNYLTASSTLDATKLSGTIPAGCYTNTTYESKVAASGGTAVSLVTTGEKYTWNNKGTYSKPSGGIPSTDLASAVTSQLIPSGGSAGQVLAKNSSNNGYTWVNQSSGGNSSAPANMVTTDGDQTITGCKTFSYDVDDTYAFCIHPESTEEGTAMTVNFDVTSIDNGKIVTIQFPNKACTLQEKLYRHNIYITTSSSVSTSTRVYAYMTIYTLKSSAYTIDTLATLIYQQGHTSTTTAMALSGMYGSNELFSIYVQNAPAAANIRLYGKAYNSSSPQTFTNTNYTSLTCTDTVKEIIA